MSSAVSSATSFLFFFQTPRARTATGSDCHAPLEGLTQHDWHRQQVSLIGKHLLTLLPSHLHAAHTCSHLPALAHTCPGLEVWKGL